MCGSWVFSNPVTYVYMYLYVHIYSTYRLCTYVHMYTWSVINKVRTTYNSSVGCDHCWGLSFGNSFLLFLLKPPKIKFYLLSKLLVTSQNIYTYVKVAVIYSHIHITNITRIYESCSVEIITQRKWLEKSHIVT